MSEAVWAVIVARVGPGAKSRLAPALSFADRHRLALAMLSDVLGVCGSADAGLHGCVAVVDEPAAHALATQAGALTIDDAHPGNMNAAVSAGVLVARQQGAGAVIVLPGDLPMLAAADLARLRAAAGDAPRAVIVGASRDGQGTNALLLRPPDVIAPAFGPPSVERHIRTGQAHGATTRVVPGLGLAYDVDTPRDLQLLADLPVGQHTANVVAILSPERAGSLSCS
jgi:2-phospho-L-lactate guanylyltransferase